MTYPKVFSSKAMKGGNMKPTKEEEDDFEDFDDEQEETPKPKPTKNISFEDEEEEDLDEEEEDDKFKFKKPVKSPVAKSPIAKAMKELEDEGEIPKFKHKEEPKEEPQIVAIPRVVSIETMMNELYDGQQEIKQVLQIIMEKIK